MIWAIIAKQQREVKEKSWSPKWSTISSDRGDYKESRLGQHQLVPSPLMCKKNGLKKQSETYRYPAVNSFFVPLFSKIDHLKQTNQSESVKELIIFNTDTYFSWVIATYPFRYSRQIVTSVNRCFNPFILNKSGNEVLVQTLSFFSALWLKFEQIFQNSSPRGCHLDKWT